MKGKRLVLLVVLAVVVLLVIWLKAEADEQHLIRLPIVTSNFDPSVPNIGCGQSISPTLPITFYAPNQMGELRAEVFGPDEKSDSFWVKIGDGEPFPYHIPDTGLWQDVKLLDLPVSGKVSIWVREEGSQMRNLRVLCPDLFCGGQPIPIEWGDIIHVGNTFTETRNLQIQLTPDGDKDSGWVGVDGDEPQWVRVRGGKSGWLPTGEYAEDPVIEISPGFHRAYVYPREGGILGGIRCTTDVFAP